MLDSKPYADPTLDSSFKLLFGNAKNKKIIISLLNNLLDFKGDDLIQDLEVIDPRVSGGGQSDVVNKAIISSTIDVLCKTVNNQKVAIEMQRQYKDYFLARTQYSLASMIYGQVPSGQSASYDVAMMKNYMLIISNDDLFVDDDDKEFYETTVTPMMHGRAKTINSNKMVWKYYELNKFRQTDRFQSKTINSLSDLKEQWLEFLCTCSDQTALPQRETIILDAYRIMEFEGWGMEQKRQYMDQLLIENSERLSREKEREKFLQEGQFQGQVKSVVRVAKKRLAKPEAKDKSLEEKVGMVIEDFDEFFEDRRFQNKQEEFVQYLEDHPDESLSQIFEGLKENNVMNLE
jgi:predicted transposase/invertase (TIGR01784 family)